MQRTPARISLVIDKVSWVGIVAHTAFVPLFAWLGHPLLALTNVFSVLIWVLAVVANRRHRSTLAMWMLVGEVSLHAVFAAMTFGWEAGFQYYLIPLVPFVMFNDRVAARPLWALSLLVFGAFIGLRAFAPVLPLDPVVGPVQVYSNLVIPFFALALVTWYFRRASMTAEAQMEHMAQTDPLTGLFNRRHMDNLLADAKEKFAQDARPFCVVMADLDHFKSVNDQSGHDAGDKVLKALSCVFGEQLRATDAVARWGGEEFLVFLPNTTSAAGLEVAQRLRAAAEAKLPLTLTLGVACFRANLQIDALLKAADEALYAGKSAGRNRVVFGEVPVVLKAV